MGQAMTATELLAGANLKHGTLAPAELERWLQNEGFATIHDGRVRPTAKAVGLIDALHLERRGDGIRNARRIS